MSSSTPPRSSTPLSAEDVNASPSSSLPSSSSDSSSSTALPSSSTADTASVPASSLSSSPPSQPSSLPAPDHVDPSSFLFSDPSSTPLSSLLQQTLDASSPPTPSLHPDPSLTFDSSTATDPSPPSPSPSSPASRPFAVDVDAAVSSSAYTLHSPVDESLPSPAAAPSPTPSPPPQPVHELHALPPNHPLLLSANAQLVTALKSQQSDLLKAVSSSHHDLSQLEKARTDLGVQLYSHQQDLAKCQMTLERQVEAFHRAAGAREAKEAEVDSLKSKVTHHKTVEADLARRRQALQAEVAELYLTIGRVKAYQSDLADEVRVAQSMTANDERTVVREEKAKAAQDALLLQLSERLHTLQHEQSTLSLQTDAQRQQNAALSSTLAQLTRELQLLHVEAKDFADRWRATVRQNEVKAEAIGMAERMVDGLREQCRSLSLQVVQSQKATRSHQAEHAQLMAFHARLQGEYEYLQGQVELIEELKQKYDANYAIILKTSNECETDLKRVHHASARVETEVAALIQQVNGLHRKAREMEEARSGKVNEELILEKNSEAMWKKIRANKSAINGHEASLIELQNEMARMRIDLMNTQQHNVNLVQTRENYAREIVKKDELIDGYEAETGKRHELISKKQNDIIRLNRELERLNAINLSTAYSETINYEGPMEIQINNLNKKIHALVQQKEATQRAWIKLQNEFVHVASEVEAVDTTTNDLTSQWSVLNTQNIRLGHEAGTTVQHETNLLLGVRQMRSHGAKMNEWIEEFKAKREQLIHDNFLTQKEFMAQLKEKEQQTALTAEQVVQLRQRKEAEKLAVLNADYQLMQMQRKLEVERETQQLLDPTVGQVEIAALRKSNAAVELCIQGAGKQLERLKAELDRLIVAKVKERNVIHPVTSKQVALKEKSMLQQQQFAARMAIGKKTKERAKLTAFVQALKEEGDMVQGELMRQQGIYNTVELSKLEVDGEVDGLSLDVKMGRERLIMAQAKLKKLEERMGKARKEDEEEKRRRRERLEEEREKGAARYTKLIDEIRRVRDEQPKYRDFIDRVLQWA